MDQELFKMLASYGIGGAVAAAALYILTRVLSWIGKRIEALQASFTQYLERTGAAFEKLAGEVDGNRAGHARTHEKLEEVHGDVRRLLPREQATDHRPQA